MRELFNPGPTGLGTSAARLAAMLGARQPQTAQTEQSQRSADSGAKSSSEITIPELHCPAPVRINEPLGAEVNHRLVAWAERIGIYPGKLDQLRESNYGRFAMLVHPDTDDPDRLLLAAQGLAVEFALDDEYCDDERTGSDAAKLGCRLALAQPAMDPVYIVDDEYAAQLEQAMRADPVRVGLAAYMDRVAQFGTPVQVDRVRTAALMMFIPMNWEAGWRMQGGHPPVWEYLATRQFNSFAPCMTLVDVVGGYEVPGALYFLPAVRRATMLAANASIILNDIYSMAREREPGIGDGGLPVLIAAERGCSLQEAVDQTAALHDETMRTFEDARAKLTTSIPSPDLWRYLAGLHAWLGGSHEFHRGLGRYSS
ncbi:2-methylisoborneol synthase [Enhygromyxa salina]|uniref:Terpene synthase n=2 Tax=Enhygromyxa salina TaxID=215803 RepID=A0A2S9YJI1_9BACT|nr:2-methylisoborneol synthase [Enhygromyxa salina]